jgi:hypothetical protein
MADDRLVRAASVAAVERFVDAMPELRDEWEEHCRFYDGPLPHVFFGDVTRYAVRTLPTAAPDVRARLGAALEELAASADGDVVNVVAVSFFEHLVFGDDADIAALELLRPHLGPASLEIVELLRRDR